MIRQVLRREEEARAGHGTQCGPVRVPRSVSPPTPNVSLVTAQFSLLLAINALRALAQVKWLPFLLQPTLPKGGVDKRTYYRQKFGARAIPAMENLKNVGRCHRAIRCGLPL